MAHVLIGLGSNLGDRQAHLAAARAALAQLPQTQLLAFSRLYETQPVGPVEQGPFLNAAAAVATELTPPDLLAHLRQMEADAGRAPVTDRPHWGPRELDLDILLFDDVVTQTADLAIPHPRLHERRFVLVPLADTPDAVHPVLGKTVAGLLADCRDEGSVEPIAPADEATLVVNEIFHSIQGEGTRAGLACTFVRLTGCHLRCGYCDTEYAFHEGARMTLGDIVSEVSRHGCDLVQVTGGEPLLQPGVHPLMTMLCDAGNTVLLETSGACDISTCDERVIRIIDLKTPDSGEAERNLWSNLDHLDKRDEVKFVLCSRGDYEWTRDIITRHKLAIQVAAVLVSAVHQTPPGRELPGCPGLSLRELTEWVLADRLPVRVQTQLHKLIWDPTARGV